MKKIIAIALAALMVCAMLTACGGKEEAGLKTVEPGKLIMATNATFPPYEFVENNKIVGIDAEMAAAIADKLGKKLVKCRIHSSDVFYHEDNVDGHQQFYQEHGCWCVELESFALFHNAKVLGKKAACLLTISDSFVSKKALSAEERQLSFHDMMQVALEAAIAAE